MIICLIAFNFALDNAAAFVTNYFVEVLTLTALRVSTEELVAVLSQFGSALISRMATLHH